MNTRTSRLITTTLLLLAPILPACKSSKKRKTKTTTTATATITARPKATAKTKAKPTATASTQAEAAPDHTTHTPVPTFDEWRDTKEELMIEGSNALNCETKMVREWFRVNCSGHSSSGGTPTTVKIIKGGFDGNTFHYMNGQVTSIVTRYAPGTNLIAVFAWTNAVKKFTLSWPNDTPKPTKLGSFE